MSTRSRIGIELPDTVDGRPGAKVHSAYCHMDGNPEGVGNMLVRHYNDFRSAAAIVGCGYISSLEVDLLASVAGSYNHQLPEENDTLAEYLSGEEWDIAYFYIFRLDGKWYYAQGGDDLKEVTPAED